MKTKKSIWIDNDIIADIQKEASDRDVKFAVVANERLRQRNDAQLPIIRAITQNIINLCRVGKYDEAQEEEDKLWTF